VKNTPTFVLIGTLVAPFALTVNVTTGVSITGSGIAIVVVVVGVVTGVVVVVVVVVVAAVVVVFWPQADTIMMAITMIMDTANENRFFLFIYVPPFYLLFSKPEAIIKLLM
jgi:type III secretory pathway component EscU